MFGSFLRLSKSDTLTKEASARVLNEVVRSCPHCRLALIGHDYRLVAATILNADHADSFRELLSAIRNHDWRKGMTFQSWEGNQPNAEVYELRCPDGALSLVVISAPFALDESHTLMHQEKADDGAVFEASLPESESWHAF